MNTTQSTSNHINAKEHSACIPIPQIPTCHYVIFRRVSRQGTSFGIAAKWTRIPKLQTVTRLAMIPCVQKPCVACAAKTMSPSEYHVAVIASILEDLRGVTENTRHVWCESVLHTPSPKSHSHQLMTPRVFLLLPRIQLILSGVALGSYYAFWGSV